MLAQNTNFGSDCIARVNLSGILVSLLHSPRHDLGYYMSSLIYQDCKPDFKKHGPITKTILSKKQCNPGLGHYQLLCRPTGMEIWFHL